MRAYSKWGCDSAARAEVKALEREADSMKAKVDSKRKRVEDMAREKDALNKQSTKAEGSVHKQVHHATDSTFAFLDSPEVPKIRYIESIMPIVARYHVVFMPAGRLAQGV